MQIVRCVLLLSVDMIIILISTSFVDEIVIGLRRNKCFKRCLSVALLHNLGEGG